MGWCTEPQQPRTVRALGCSGARRHQGRRHCSLALGPSGEVGAPGHAREMGSLPSGGRRAPASAEAPPRVTSLTAPSSPRCGEAHPPPAGTPRALRRGHQLGVRVLPDEDQQARGLLQPVPPRRPGGRPRSQEREARAGHLPGLCQEVLSRSSRGEGERQGAPRAWGVPLRQGQRPLCPRGRLRRRPSELRKRGPQMGGCRGAPSLLWGSTVAHAARPGDSLGTSPGPGAAALRRRRVLLCDGLTRSGVCCVMSRRVPRGPAVATTLRSPSPWHFSVMFHDCHRGDLGFWLRRFQLRCVSPLEGGRRPASQAALHDAGAPCGWGA